MKRILAIALLLAACAASSEAIWLKPGADALTAEQDFLACAAKARRDFGTDRRIQTSPRVTIGVGACRTGICAGLENGAEVFDRDDNEGLRDRALNACMVAKGYALTDLPACPRGTARPLASQPFDTRGLCVANGRIAAP